MKRLTFEEMAFSRASDAWCPITGKAVGPNVPRVCPEHILASVGTATIYHKFNDTQGFVRYSNEVGCYDRAVDRTHVYTDELNTLETALSGVPNFVRGPCGSGLSQDGRPLEVLTVGPTDASAEWFLVDTMIHGNEPDGILGTLKAFELLATHPDFAPLRDQYSIALMPCCNPDGYYLGQRNLDILGPHPTGVPTGINLNRVWPWMWDEFTPTIGESKGDAPITCSLESQAMEDWRTPGGIPKKIAWALDQHSTAGDGARYASRDRCFRNITEEEYEKIWGEWSTYRLLRAIQAKRVHEDSNPDLWINYFRSRWRPHWHSYLSTLSLSQNGGIPCVSLVGEHNKVPNQVVDFDLETYKSASDYNFDHIIALALVAQGGATERKTAVFIEHEVGENQILNSDFVNWSTASAYRPLWWRTTRLEVLQSAHGESHMESTGRPVSITVDVVMELAANNWCDDTGGSDIIENSTGSIILTARADTTAVGVLSVHSWDINTDPVLLFVGADSTADHPQWRLGKASVSGSVCVIGLGKASTSTDAVFDRYVNTAGVWSVSRLATHTDSLEDAAASLDEPNGNLYIFGGIGTTGNSAKVFKANCNLGSEGLTEIGTDLLGSGDYGMGSCFVSSGDLAGCIVLIGGIDDGSSGLLVRVFDTSDNSLTEYLVDAGEFADTEPGFNPSVQHCAAVSNGNTIWFYGGQTAETDNIYHSAWSITWNGSGFDPIVNNILTAGLSDDGDPEDYSADENWIRKFRYWRGLRTRDAEIGYYTHFLFGGLERLSDGTDESDLTLRKGFFCHYVDTSEFGRPSDYNFGYFNYNSHLDATEWRKATTTWSMKAATVDDNSQSAVYVRLNNAPGDDVAGTLTTRRVRTYYMHPPQWWWREGCSINLEMATPLVTENELRLYIRGYRQGQSFLADAPMVQINTLWPSSWSPIGTTRAIEEATWTNTLDPRWFRVCLDWLPGSIFTTLSEDTKLATIGDTAGYRFELWAINPTDQQREYNRSNVVGTAEPILRLIRIAGEIPDENIDIPCYWGGALRDIAMGRFDSPIQIEIWNHLDYGTGLVVRNGWAEGWNKFSTKDLPSGWPTIGDIVLHAGGWWGEPQMEDMDTTWHNKCIHEDFPQGALLIGDRDPTSGQISYKGTFRYTDTFTRSNSTNLGDNWNMIQQTGNGWNVHSNQAQCEQKGWEVWTAYPYLRNCSVLAEVSAPNGGKVGLFTRLNWKLSQDEFAHGYCGYLHCTGASTANLILARHYLAPGEPEIPEEGEDPIPGEPTENTTILATQAVTYTASATVTLELAALDNAITLTMSGAHTGTVTTTDSNHLLPGAFGLFGETPGAGQYVYANNVRADVPAGTKLRITE
jgi:hypothetical protein